MRWIRTDRVVAVCAMSIAAALIFISSDARGAEWGHWGYAVYGNLGTGVNYTRDSSGESTSWNFGRSDNYSLGLSGNILDPRLALFNISGALSTNDGKSDSSNTDSRLLSFIGNLSLLSGKPYPLDLRISQSHFTGSGSTDALSFGGTWRIVYGELPSLFLNFDRSTIDGKAGETKIQSAFTTGSIRVAKHIFDSDVDAEIGIQNFADDVRRTSSTRYFGRFSDAMRWSPVTSLNITGDYFTQEDSRSMGANFSLFNRPDATLSRTLNLAIRNTSGKEQGDTTLSGGGAITKTYQPYPTLSLTPFSSAFLLRRFGSGETEDATQGSWSIGSSLVSRYFRPVVASADYGLGLSYSQNQEEGSTLGTTQQFHVGLESATLQPYRVRGDYLVTLENTLVDRLRNQVSLRAEGPITERFFFRTFAEFFNDRAKFSGQRTAQTTISFGGNVGYTGIRQLYFDLGANAVRTADDAQSSWITQVLSNLSYTPMPRLNLQLNATRETDTLSDVVRYRATARAMYLFGKTTLNLEYRVELRQNSGNSGLSQSVHFMMNRPFRFDF